MGQQLIPGRVQPFTSFAPIQRGEAVFDRLVGQGTQGLNLLTALDSLLQQQQAQADPTIPALLNTQLARLSDHQSGGGFDLNAALGGLFAQPDAATSFGAGHGGPFDLPVQSAQPLRQTSVLENALGGPGGLLDDIGIFLQDPFRHPGGDLSEFTAPQLSQQQLQDFGIPPQQRPQPPPQPGLDALIAGAGIEPLGPGPQPQQDTEGTQSSGTHLPGNTTFLPRSGAMPDLRPPSLVGSFAQGTNFVPETGLAQVHKGEAIVPANQNPFNQTPVTRPLNQPQALSRSSGGARVGETGAERFRISDTPPPAPPNPLQTSINTLQGLATSGGPITPEIQGILQQQALSQQNQFQNDTLRGIREDFGARGLGLSGVEANAELQARLARDANLLNANQNIALNAASQNFGATQGAAGLLGQTALGSGQLGLQNAQFQHAAENSILDMISQLLSQSHATPEQFASSRPSQVSLV